MGNFLALASGALFGLGLIGAGMTEPAKVKGFLDLFGRWDPSLALVMAGAIAVGVFAFARARRQERAWSGERMELPDNRVIDARLIVGGLLFGTGWGIAGYCPGPALVAAGGGSLTGAVFCLAMLVGMALHDTLAQRR